MRILFIFLDGVGLGANDPGSNPFAVADLPTLNMFTGGRRWSHGLKQVESRRGIFVPTDACLGVEGKPQSATGQATIMTGVNVPQIIGRHYGPKPNPKIAGIVRHESVVKRLVCRGLKVRLANAYPPSFFEAIQQGKRLLSSNQLALEAGSVRFPDMKALLNHHAISADFTGKGWHTELGYTGVPILAPFEAGQLLVRLSEGYDFTFFDHWITDYVGHRGKQQDAVELLNTIDQVIDGLLAAWDDSTGLIVITSDHGNIEDFSKRGHTRNSVPTLVIGNARRVFAQGIVSLVDITPSILRVLNDKS